MRPDGFARNDSAGLDASGVGDVSVEKTAFDASASDKALPLDLGSTGFDGAADRAAATFDAPANPDTVQPDLGGVAIQPDAQGQQDTASLFDGPVVLSPDASVQPDAAVAPDAVPRYDAPAVQDGPPDAPVVPIPDAATILSDAPAGVPQITSIEGTGTAAAVAPRAADVAAWTARAADRRPASKRISSTNPVLDVTGTGLGGVTQATLKGRSGQGEHSMTIGAASAAASGSQARFFRARRRLPTTSAAVAGPAHRQWGARCVLCRPIPRTASRRQQS